MSLQTPVLFVSRSKERNLLLSHAHRSRHTHTHTHMCALTHMRARSQTQPLTHMSRGVSGKVAMFPQEHLDIISRGMCFNDSIGWIAAEFGTASTCPGPSSIAFALSRYFTAYIAVGRCQVSWDALQTYIRC